MGVAEDVAQAVQSLFASVGMSGRHVFVHFSVVDSLVPFRLLFDFLAAYSCVLAALA